MTIAFLTDFGTHDWFVASAKAAIPGISPRAAIVDITHEIPPGDIRTASFCLFACYRDFPKGTVFVVVVDPGVGSRRLPLIVQADGYFFIGPDNGVLWPVLSRCEKFKARRIANKKFMAKTISATFHARDVFAPAAAHLANGTSFKNFGPVVTVQTADLVPVPETINNEIHGRIVYFDRFGNALTNITLEIVPKKRNVTVEIKGKKIKISKFYQKVPGDTPLAILGSAGFLEISVNGGSAKKKLKLSVDDPVVIR